MADTSISWTDKVWNATRGCSRVSPGCGGASGMGGCYAERMAIRMSGPGQPYEGLVRSGPQGPRWTGLVILAADKLVDPWRWRKPSRVFVNSMSDLFHEALTNEEIAAVFGVMAAARQHTFQILTKRAERMHEWFKWVMSTGDEPGSLQAALGAYEPQDQDWAGYLNAVLIGAAAWPLPNVHIGVSAEDQKRADERIPWLLKTPARVRFVSYEPALGPIRLCRGCPGCPNDCGWQPVVNGHGISWIIYGDESGPGARPADLAWARSTVAQCRAAGVPVFVKQLVIDGHLRKDMADFPEDLRVQEFPQ